LQLTSSHPHVIRSAKENPRPSELGRTTLHKSAEGKATRHDSLDQPVICAGSVVGQAYTGEQVLEAGVGAEVIDP